MSGSLSHQTEHRFGLEERTVDLDLQIRHAAKHHLFDARRQIRLHHVACATQHKRGGEPRQLCRPGVTCDSKVIVSGGIDRSQPQIVSTENALFGSAFIVA